MTDIDYFSSQGKEIDALIDKLYQLRDSIADTEIEIVTIENKLIALGMTV